MFRDAKTVPYTQRLLVIAGTGLFLIASELLTIHSFNPSLEGLARDMGTLFQRLSVAVEFVSAAEQTPVTAHFQWNWRDRQELMRDQSLRNAKLTEERRKAIASVIADQIRPMMADREIQSEIELRKAALDTRVKMIDLNGDGVPEVVAQGMVSCAPTGNCPFWVFQKKKFGYELLLDGEAQTFTLQMSGANGFRDIVLSRHGSSSSGDLTHYKYREGAYQEVGCYDYEWTVLEGDEIRELREPRLTPCSERNK